MLNATTLGEANCLRIAAVFFGTVLGIVSRGESEVVRGVGGEFSLLLPIEHEDD